ncbi:MAG TPA: hypothetical protein DD672_03940, partial [Gammaproteobacteria bacterium]|nr:hypothetical protein [Gammaproteobacteria bacterium]
ENVNPATVSMRQILPTNAIPFINFLPSIPSGVKVADFVWHHLKESGYSYAITNCTDVYMYVGQNQITAC